jgi:hypothetical protein
MQARGWTPLRGGVSPVRANRLLRSSQQWYLFTPWIDAIGGGTETRFIHRLFGLYA